jgi:hypothetical protein
LGSTVQVAISVCNPREFIRQNAIAIANGLRRCDPGINDGCRRVELNGQGF